MTQKLKQNPMARAAMQSGQLLAAVLLTLGLIQERIAADDAVFGLPSGSGMQDSDLSGLRGQGVNREAMPGVGLGVILWDEDAPDRSGLPGGRDSAVDIRIEIGTQP